jgi:hypothetical protein
VVTASSDGTVRVWRIHTARVPAGRGRRVSQDHGFELLEAATRYASSEAGSTRIALDTRM